MSERVSAQGARRAETAMYTKYMRISSTAQHSDGAAQPLSKSSISKKTY